MSDVEDAVALRALLSRQGLNVGYSVDTEKLVDFVKERYVGSPGMDQVIIHNLVSIIRKLREFTVFGKATEASEKFV